MKIHNFTLCDIVRREDNGKYLLIGAYSNEIIFPAFPATFQFSLWFLAEHEVLRTDEIALRGRTSIDEDPFFTMEGEVEVRDTSNWSPLGVGVAVTFREPCTLYIEAKINENDWILLREARIRQGDVTPFMIVPPAPES
ncbi:DUF6941 family protein [Rhizobium leguminosarum]|uniref:DUF6941 family protein n=1 Tax=Rhizobium leguminosarum TaxID=384 RepID=UPI0039657ED2